MICRGYARALDAALGAFASISKTVDLKDNDALP